MIEGKGRPAKQFFDELPGWLQMEDKEYSI